MPETTFELQHAEDLVSALKICLDLRSDGFWSFRGQRDPTWPLRLHGEEEVDDLDKLFNEFRRRCMEFPPPHFVEEEREWRWLFFAQHHRLKTRLLDWTKDPLVAIYFAVEDIISKGKDCSPGAVWALQVHSGHFKREYQLRVPPDETEWIMVNPPPVTARLARQSGLFTYHPGRDCRVALSELPRRPGEKLIKIDFPGSTEVTKHIREQLGILNVHHGSLFPDPQGIAEFVNLEWPPIAFEKNLYTRRSNPREDPRA
jgi:FRG domain